MALVVLSFPEETEEEGEDPEGADSPPARFSWLPASLRKPLVTGYSANHLPSYRKENNIYNTRIPLFVFKYFLFSHTVKCSV